MITEEFEPIRDVIRRVYEAVPDSRIAKEFENCYSNTITKTLKKEEDGTAFIITGDIPAMWLRDSACQLRPYLFLAADHPDIADLIEGVIRRQVRCINMDPYANAFNEREDGSGHQDDETEMKPGVWERKYEIDSLCFPVQLSWLFWKKTGRTGFLNDEWKEAARQILRVFRTEQNHEEKSPYRFERRNCPETDTLPRGGKGAPVRDGIGLIWSGFRPSDDACTYGYLIPSNMFASVILGQMAEIAGKVFDDSGLRDEAAQLSREVAEAVRKYGTAEADGKTVYVYETDGDGHHLIMDDANFPSLLSAPYLGYGDVRDGLYQDTRALILSGKNPYYYKGKALQGIGSPHTPSGNVWDLSLAMQGITSDDRAEKERILKLMVENDDGTGMMHESINCNDPSDYTRPWFSWGNAVFCELVLQYAGIDDVMA